MDFIDHDKGEINSTKEVIRFAKKLHRKYLPYSERNYLAFEIVADNNGLEFCKISKGDYL